MEKLNLNKSGSYNHMCPDVPLSQAEPQQLQYTTEAACCELTLIQESNIFRCIIQAYTWKDFHVFRWIHF